MSSTTYELSHLRELEAESIHIMREVAAEFERPVLLFSGGKDSIVMLRLAEKAFWPARIPFPVMHIDTGHNFDEVIEFRDRRVGELGVKLVVASVQDAIDSGRVAELPGRGASTTDESTLVNTSECSRCRTGPNSTSGSTSQPRMLRSRLSTTPMNVRCFEETGCSSLFRVTWPPARERNPSPAWSGTEQLETQRSRERSSRPQQPLKRL